MRAVQYSEFGGPDVLRVVDVPAPEAGEGALRIDVRAAAVNVFDLKKRSGAFGGDLPIVPGHDAAGVTEDGRRVFGSTSTGAYAEVCLLHHWTDMPDSLSFEEAASFVTLSEASVRSLELVGVAQDSTVVIAGATGAVGSTAVQFALARGARVIGTTGPDRSDYLRELGAEPVPHDALASVGHADAGFDAAGRGAVRDLIALTGDPRKVVTIADFDAEELGVHVTSQTSAWHALAEAAALHSAGRLHVRVAERFALEDAADAHRLVEAGGAHGKVVLTP